MVHEKCLLLPLLEVILDLQSRLLGPPGAPPSLTQHKQQYLPPNSGLSEGGAETWSSYPVFHTIYNIGAKLLHCRRGLSIVSVQTVTTPRGRIFWSHFGSRWIFKGFETYSGMITLHVI